MKQPEPFGGDLHLAGPLVERLLHLESALVDLKFAHEALVRLRDLMGETDGELLPIEEFDITQLALWNAAILAYARCFVAGVRHAAMQELVPAERVETHRTLYQLRAEHLAHFGRDSDHETVTMVGTFSFEADGRLAVSLKTRGVKAALPTSWVLPNYIDHIDAVLQATGARFAETVQTMEKELGAMDLNVLFDKLRRGAPLRMELPSPIRAER